MEINRLIVKQQKEGLESFSKEELLLLKKHYSVTMKYRQGLDMLATGFDLEKIEKLLDA